MQNKGNKKIRLKNLSLNFGEQMFKALSEQSRIRIINLLLQAGQLSTSDLELILDFTQTKTSRHLSYLKNSGIISTYKQDQWSIHTIRYEVKGLVATIFNLLEKDSQLLKDNEIYQILKSNRELSDFKRSGEIKAI